MFPNLFFYGDVSTIKKDNPEIALSPDGKINTDKYWFNVDGFETQSARGRRQRSRRGRSRSTSTACAGRACST